MKANEFLRVAFYLRVSTEEQVKDWYWLEYQADAIEQLVEFKSTQPPFWTHDKRHRYIDEGDTGSNLNRKDFKRMMADAKKWEFDIVVVWKIDRLSRNLSHLLRVFEELKSYKVWFYSIKENLDFSWPVGKLIFQIFWALAEFEREMIKSRTSEWKKASAKRWNYIWNGIPYWYDTIKKSSEKWTKLEIVEWEAKIVRKIFTWFVFEQYHYLKIVSKLNDLNIPKWVAARVCNKGTKWHQSTIKNMLQNTAYAWTRVENIKDDDGEPERIEVTVPQIIEEDIFEFAQLRIKEINNGNVASNNGGGENKYLLSRKIVDVETWKCLVWYTRYRGQTYGYRRKAFTDNQTAKRYKNVDITWEAIDSYIWEKLQIAIERPEKLFLMFQKQVSHGNDLSQLKTSSKELWELIQQNALGLEAIEVDYYKWQISEQKKDTLITKLTKANNRLEKQKSEVDQNIENLLTTLYSKELIKKTAKQFSKNLKSMSLEQKQLIVEALIEKIIVKIHDNWEKHIKVIFKFDPKNINWKTPKDELKNGISYSKSNDAACETRVNGNQGLEGYIYLYIQAKLNSFRKGRIWHSEFIDVPFKANTWLMTQTANEMSVFKNSKMPKDFDTFPSQ